MRKKIIIACVILLPVIAYLGLRSNKSSDTDEYKESVLSKRLEKEDYLKTSASSPFANEKEKYKDLVYFPIDEKYKVKAKVKKFEELVYVNVGQSNGTSERYLKYATLSFVIDETDMELVVLKPAGFGQMNVLFTAFADETSSEETYGGGRYLDLDFKNADTIDLDFNLAYNPYCAYNEDFSCPLPPRENLLPIRIEAGEKKFHD
ncbi:MAG: DUF1684 domain-containing protein [Cyclobacteriaceae bacterium]